MRESKWGVTAIMQEPCKPASQEAVSLAAPLSATFSFDVLAPYSGAIQSVFDYAAVVRRTMSQANIDRLDDLLIKGLERLDKVIEGISK